MIRIETWVRDRLRLPVERILPTEKRTNLLPIQKNAKATDFVVQGVYIPQDRAHEIGKVLQEQRERERRRAATTWYPKPLLY